MKKNLTRILSLLLVLVLMVGVLPVSALADGWDLTGELDTEQLLERAEPVEMQASEKTAYEYSIMFLDCGRKYYSVNSIKKLIDNASAAGFNYIQLAVGNDGLRLLLDDMSLTVDSKTYSSKQVSDAIHAGNEKYYNFLVDELTQNEMDTIIAYANSKGMGVIPCVNTPGHMDAILYAASSLTGEDCAYSGSARTIDVTNTTAVAFTQALLQKYITYFAGKGCQLFNMGADEYANDKFPNGGMGFGNLQSTGKYSYYVTYVNKVAEMIKTAGMKPMAFNDGIYFNNNTSSGTFDTDIIICYWSNGWSGYYPMSASDLAAPDKGFKLVNTSGAYYWVLGGGQCSAEKARGFNYQTFPKQGGDETISNPAGAMFCIWADSPGAETEASVISKTADTIAAFGGTLPETKPGSTTPVFKVVGDVPNGGTLTMGSALTLRVPEGMTAIWTAYPEGIVELTAPVATRSAAVTANSVNVMPLKAGDVTITATNPDDNTQKADFALTVSDPDAPKTETVTLTVGSTKKYVVDGNLVDSVTSDGFNTAVAEYSVVYTPVAGTPIETPVTALSENSSYYIKSSSGKYLNASAEWVASIENAVQWTWDGQYLKNGNLYVRYSSYYRSWSTTARINYASTFEFNNGVFSDTSYGKSLGSPVTLTESAPADKTTITFTGKSIGETSIKVGNVTYLIEVVDKAPDNALTGDLTLEYWITNRPVYKEKSNISENQKVTLSAADEGVSHPDGIAIDTKTPVGYTYDGNNWSTVYYWMTVRLDSNHKQTSANGVDQTAAGTTLTHVRYHAGAWKYKTLDGTWTYFESGDQVVAYYLQKTTVTKDIETYVKDWGSVPGASEGYVATRVALTIAIVYPDGTIQPAEEKMYSEATTIFNYWNNRDIGIIVPKINKNYNISKMTVTDGTRQINSSDNNRYAWSANDTIKWETVKNEAGVDWYDETLVWDHSMNTEPIINASGLTGELKTKCTWSAANTAKLVLIYLEPIQKDTNLNIVYHNDTDNEAILQSQIAMVYNAGDAQPTYDNSLHYNNASLDIPYDRKWSGTAPGEPNYLPDEAYVVNAAGNNQTFNKNVAKIPGVAPKYKSGFYKYNGADVSADGKTLTLHYAIDNTKLTKQYVLDFGLPLHIPLKDLIENDDLNTVEAVYANGVPLNSTTDYTTQHGTLRYDAASHEIIYTRTATFSDNTISTANFQIKYAGVAALSKTITIGVIPASNILYEENFLTPGVAADNEIAWMAGESSAPTTPQETQKVVSADENLKFNVFGFDNAYADKAAETGVWKASGLEQSNITTPLTTSFYGNGFDLIGNCGPNTGRVLMIISPADQSHGDRIVYVDTRYNTATLHQVPLAHVEFPSDSQYHVEIYASGLNATTVTPTSRSSIATASLADAYSAAEDELLLSLVRRHGLTLADVEYVTMDNVIPASGAADVSLYGMPSAAALTADAQTSIRHEAGTHVEIDSFRVYRSTDKDDDIAGKYPTAEQNIVYNNILDVVKGEILAFTEGNPANKIAITNYEAAGGPQNEIYIGQTQAISFRVEGATEIQVSLRAVQGDTSWADTTTGRTPTPISTNTEMYYTVHADTNGVFTITNRGSGLLAIGNVKLPSGARTMSASEIDEDALRASLCAALGLSAEQPQAFQPKTFSARATTLPMLRNKRVSVLITISNDVSYVTVNGVKYTPSRYYASWQKTRLIQFGETLGKYESKTYTIIAYDANGVASAPITVNG